MPFKSKLSKSAVDSAGKRWTRNLKQTTTRRPNIPELHTDMNEALCKMPLNRDVISRFLGLYPQLKSRASRLRTISEELIKLWNKLSFPVLSEQQISYKVDKLIKQFEKHRKRQNKNFEGILSGLFDITKPHGLWICSEDKELYKKQVASGGRVGYTTEKVAALQTIHPSKRPKQLKTTTTNQVHPEDFSSSTDSEESKSSSDFAEEAFYLPAKRKRNSTASGSKLVSTASMSTAKASFVLHQLAEEGVNVPTPSQSGIWRRVIEDAKAVKKKLKEIISKEEFCLHFDGKRIDSKEFQVVCLKNSARSLNLGVLACSSGSAEDIFTPMKALLDEYDAWRSVKMIISDTTAVNTGHQSGVIIRLQRQFKQLGLEEPQYIGCQHHILDLILRHVLDYFFPAKSRSPNINYDFIEDILTNYDDLQQNYSGTNVIPKQKNLGWRDDFRFLYELCEAYKYYQTEGKWPVIKWKKLPSLHNARWNSRAIFALIAFFLLPNYRNTLKMPCDFIANSWAKAWFCILQSTLCGGYLHSASHCSSKLEEPKSHKMLLQALEKSAISS